MGYSLWDHKTVGHSLATEQQNLYLNTSIVYIFAIIKYACNNVFLHIFLCFSQLPSRKLLTHFLSSFSHLSSLFPAPSSTQMNVDKTVCIFLHLSLCLSMMYGLSLFSSSAVLDPLWPYGLQHTKVLHYLPEFVQTHVLRVSGAIQPSHPLLSSSPPALSLSQYLGLFQGVGSSHQVAKVLELQLQHQSFQWIFRVDFL